MRPPGHWNTPYPRELRVVGEHAIAAPGVWEKQVGPALLGILSELNIQWNTIDLHRIPYLDLEYNDPAPSHVPVVVCIGVKLGTLSGEYGAIVAKQCQQVLDTFGLNDVEVAIKASERFQSVAPAFEKPQRSKLASDSDHPIARLRMPFTSAVGFPLSTEARPDAEGSSGFFFTNGEDTSKVYLLTARHVVVETTTRDKNTVYDYKSANKYRRQNVTIFGEKGIAEHMRAIRVAIGDESRSMSMYQQWIDDQQDQVDETQGKDMDAVRKLKDTQGLFDRAQETMKDLEKVYEDVAKLYLSKFGRTVGFVSYSPPIGFSLGEHMYTEDVAIIEVDADKIDAGTFRPNVLDLGFEIKAGSLVKMMDPHWPTNTGDPPSFEYPRNRLLPLSSIIPDSELRGPKEKDRNGDRCIMVLKRGRTTGLTVGRINNVPSYTRTYWEDGTTDVSMEWPIFSYGYDLQKRSSGFSEPGDSGSAVVDGKGRIAGIITGGAGYVPAVNTNTDDLTATADVTYMTPAEFIYNQMLARGIEMNVKFSLT